MDPSRRPAPTGIGLAASSLALFLLCGTPSSVGVSLAEGLSVNGSHVNLLNIPDGYEPRTYPDPSKHNGGLPTRVDMTFVVEDILEVNDQTFSMTVELKILMSWRDRRLALNPVVLDKRQGQPHYDTEQLVLEDGGERESVWSPNFSISHLIEFHRLETLRPQESLMVVPEGGGLRDFSFLHEGNYVVRLKCPMKFDTFPFDRHICYFETFVEKASDVVTLRYIDADGRDGDGDEGVWGWAATTTTIEYVTRFSALPEGRRTKTMRRPRGEAAIDVSVTGFQIELIRKVNYFIFNYFVPSGLFVVISWVSFVIPPDSVPGRIALIITTLLVLVNISNSVFASSPAAESINSLQMWILICISFVSITVAEYAVVLFLIRQHRRTRIKKTLAGVKSLVVQVASASTAPAVGNTVGPAGAGEFLRGSSTSLALNSDENNGSARTDPAKLRKLRRKMEDGILVPPAERLIGSSESGGREAEAYIDGEAELQVMIANIDYSFVVLLSLSFVVFNVFFWVTH